MVFLFISYLYFVIIISINIPNSVIIFKKNIFLSSCICICYSLIHNLTGLKAGGFKTELRLVGALMESKDGDR